MDRIRRVGGEMESHRRPAGSRLLLPYEIQLCEAVGITSTSIGNFLIVSSRPRKSVKRNTR